MLQTKVEIIVSN